LQDRPTATELLDAVQRFLDEELVPVLDGPQKFHARVAANVVRIVQRQLAHDDAHLQREWLGLDRVLDAEVMPTDRDNLCRALRRRNDELCERIRQGDADSEAWRARVIAHLRQTVTDKLAVSNPRYLASHPFALAASTAAAADH